MKGFKIFSLLTVLLFISNVAFASEVDVLLKKLVEKGILNASEAQEIRTETNEEVAKVEAHKLDDYKKLAKDNMPDWVKNTKLKGDFRLRYQHKHEKADNDFAKDTNLGRIRLRLGLESKVNDKLIAGVGIASGSGDPRSTNISFGGYNEKKTVVLDYAYAKYSPFSWLNLVGGKMLLNDALWEPTDLVWDTDITPEGGIAQLSTKLGPNATLFLNSGVLVVDSDTSTDANGPTAFLIQPGIDYKVNDRVSLKSAISYDALVNTKDHTSSKYSSQSNTGNTIKGSSSYSYDYKMLNPELELTIKKPFETLGLGVDFLKFQGEYVNNLAVSDKATGFATGFKLGKDKIEKWGDWQFKYIYTMLGRDAVLDVLPDSDRYGGATGIRSHEGELNFGLGKNTFLGFDVYRSWSLIGREAPETLVQVDWNLKW